MVRTRIILVLVVMSLLGVHAGPADAARDPRAAREQARDRKAQLAKELDGLEASDEELLAAVAALD